MGRVVFLDVRVQGWIGEISLAAGTAVIATLLVSSVTTHYSKIYNKSTNKAIKDTHPLNSDRVELIEWLIRLK